MRYPIITILILCGACSKVPQAEAPLPGRWYTASQVTAGEPLYQQYCATCHAADGSATSEWRTPDANGNYPPPPLNGSAHTWHHPLEVLDQTIVNGGVEFGGVMPGFGTVLAEADRLAIIAWFQSLWADDIYRRWWAIEQRD
ncbi:MAG: c-type cytochrome [Woeseiaceae bacterium]